MTHESFLSTLYFALVTAVIDEIMPYNNTQHSWLVISENYNDVCVI